MNGRKTLIGISVLCALLVSAVAAQSASAISGTTVFTCKKGAGEGGATFAGSHCKSGESSGEYGHYKVAEKTSTELAGHVVGNMVVKVSIGGQAVTFTATTVTGSGTVENKVDASGEHYVEATASGIYGGVTVAPFTKCFVYTHDGTGTPGAKNVIDTEQLRTTSTEQGDAVKISPVEGEVITRFWILDKNKVGAGGECGISGTFKLTGSIKGKPNGATFVFSHSEITEQNTFKCGSGETGSKAGVEGSIAIEARGKPEEGYTPLSVTTVAT